MDDPYCSHAVMSCCLYIHCPIHNEKLYFFSRIFFKKYALMYGWSSRAVCNGAQTILETFFLKLHNYYEFNTCVVNTQNSNSLDLNLPAAFQQKMPLTCKT